MERKPHRLGMEEVFWGSQRVVERIKHQKEVGERKHGKKENTVQITYVDTLYCLLK